ncbi:hypothetical protein H072_10484 [Dactylellina haptotyla CBS 200.50]|uniref:N-acetyltransferase domain-containing protein n=1 Tax=Dactylellina haptotyla (strain CBS 200.50) TaxID=1284197 RepID=S7ZZ28_DACHA|nr:hypothetical protein H072_10484 [Dactylellina haptotyla CBS 200.50]
MASSMLMSNSKPNSNCATATPAAVLLSTITNSKTNPTSNSNGTLVIENQALKVTNLTPDVAAASAPPLPPPHSLPPSGGKQRSVNATTLSVVIPPSKPPINSMQQMILVKEVQLPSPSSSRSSTSNFSSKEVARHHEVRVVGWKECKAVALTLAEAFKDDDVSFYFLRTEDAARRSEAELWKLHVKVCEYVVAAHCMHGLVLSIGANHEGVALWMPPGKDYDDVWSIFRSGTLPAARGLGYARKLVEYVTKIADATNAPCYLESSHPHNRKIYERFGFDFRRQVHLTRVNRGANPIPWDIMVREPVVCTSVPTGKEA